MALRKQISAGRNDSPLFSVSVNRKVLAFTKHKRRQPFFCCEQMDDESRRIAEEEAADAEQPRESGLQTSGPCMFKDACKAHGKTMYVCMRCQGRFHHLCSSSIGGSDEMNMCSAACIGPPPVAVQKKPKTKQDTLPHGAFEQDMQGVEITTLDSDDDSKSPPRKKETRKADAGMKKVLKKASSITSQKTGLNAFDSGNDDSDLEDTRTGGRSGSRAKQSTHKPKSAARADRPAAREDRPAAREDRPADRDDRPADREDRPADREEVPADREEGPAGREDQPKGDDDQPAGRERSPKGREDRPAPREEPADREDRQDEQESISISSEHSSTAGSSKKKRSSGRKTAAKKPNLVPDNYAPPKIRGQRPTVNPRHPNHRQMTFPLLPAEPVVFLDADGNTRVGRTVRRVDSEDEVVSVRYRDEKTNTVVTINDLTTDDMSVIKWTDFLIYSGVRYFVFGPPENTFPGMLWGSAWLDIVAERENFVNSDPPENSFFELKRLDMIVTRYPGVKSCPVLILGFLQGVDDSDWKAIGLMNCDNDNVASTEESITANISYMSMTDIKRDHAKGFSIIVDQEVDFQQSGNPVLDMYFASVKYIIAHAKGEKRWLPPKTWRMKLTNSWSSSAKPQAQPESKPCSRCPGLEKQLAKATVSVP